MIYPSKTGSRIETGLFLSIITKLAPTRPPVIEAIVTMASPGDIRVSPSLLTLVGCLLLSGRIADIAAESSLMHAKNLELPHWSVPFTHVAPSGKQDAGGLDQLQLSQQQPDPQQHVVYSLLPP